MVTIDQTSCNACGICISICHESCISLENEQLIIDYTFCSTCSQCIAVCPRQALSWNGIKPQVFDHSNYPGPNQIEELFKQRRTNRSFRGGKIERSVLEEIVCMAAYAPTHSYDYRVLIIDDPGIIDTIDRLIVRYSLRIYRWLFRPGWMHWFVRTFTPSREYEFLKAKPKLEHLKRDNRLFKVRPSAIIMIIGDTRIPLSLESAQFAQYNMDLYAQSMGFACRSLVGNQMFLNGKGELRKHLGMKRHEKIYGTLAIDYPSIKFRNKVVGRQPEMYWNHLRN